MLTLVLRKTERLKLTWAKLARTRRGKVAEMRRETLHSTMKETMNEGRREVMFCKDDKSNDYEMDRYNPESEGLNGQDEYSSNNESLESLNPIVVERSEKALLI
uniref:Uncharacterized protein n=1 Tax=Salix viminalis TaxID=40686 RepID=A0A6N2KS40_SALVM